MGKLWVFGMTRDAELFTRNIVNFVQNHKFCITFNILDKAATKYLQTAFRK